MKTNLETFLTYTVLYTSAQTASFLRRAADKGFSLTLMERLVKEFGDQNITSTLTTQYRMHNSIMTWPSHALYEDGLAAHESVATHLLRLAMHLLYDLGMCMMLF